MRLDLFAVAVSLIAAPALSQAADMPESRGQLSKSDYRFAQEAAQGGRFEVLAGELTQQKASNPQVKQFGEFMVSDHGTADAELKQIAAEKNAVLPAHVSDKEQDLLNRLKGLSGNDYDKTCVKHMVKDHEKDLKAFASKGANMIAGHLQRAKDLESSLTKNK